MFNYLLLVFFTIFTLNSCTAKNIDLLSDDSLYKLGLENTKVKVVLYKDNVEGVLNITYLNPTDPKKYDKKYNVFLTGIYLNDKNEKYNITLNNKKYLSKELLDKSSSLYKNIPSFNPYSKYYIMKFEKDKSKKLIFKLNYKDSNTIIEFKTF